MSSQVVEGAGHLFEEPGTLAEVAHVAAGWFRETLGAVAKVETTAAGG